VSWSTPLRRCWAPCSMLSLHMATSSWMGSCVNCGHWLTTICFRCWSVILPPFSSVPYSSPALNQIINNTTSCYPSTSNPQSVFESTTRKPALGPSFTALTDTTLWLSKYDEEPMSNEDCFTSHAAEVFRSRTTVNNLRTSCSSYLIVYLALKYLVHIQNLPGQASTFVSSDILSHCISMRICEIFAITILFGTYHFYMCWHQSEENRCAMDLQRLSLVFITLSLRRDSHDTWYRGI
jgi:hypothetical protein